MGICDTGKTDDMVDHGHGHSHGHSQHEYEYGDEGNLIYLIFYIVIIIRNYVLRM